MDIKVPSRAIEVWEAGDKLTAAQLFLSAFDLITQARICTRVLFHVPTFDCDFLETQVSTLNTIVSSEEIMMRRFAKVVFATIRKRVLELEEKWVLRKAEKHELLVLYVAENVAKTVYNSSEPDDDFDEDAAAWVFKSADDYFVFSKQKRSLPEMIR